MDEKKQSTEITRRKLLKLIAAGGGALAGLTLLPDKWVKPVLGSGVLPVHAASSTTSSPTISSSSATYYTSAPFSGGQDLMVITKSAPNTVALNFHYHDPLGEVDASTDIFATMSGNDISGTLGSFAGDGKDDTVSNYIFDMNSVTNYVPGSYSFYISVGGRSSNTLSGTVHGTGAPLLPKTGVL
jgi:hypothetical protein